MIQAFNTAAHFFVGFWIGWNYDSPASWKALAVFLSYQIVEAWKKKDKAYPEIQQSGIGFGLGLSARWCWELWKAKKTADQIIEAARETILPPLQMPQRDGIIKA